MRTLKSCMVIQMLTTTNAQKQIDAHMEYILNDMNDCVDPCKDIEVGCSTSSCTHIVDTDWLVDNMPGMNYVKSRAVNYIFSNGLATGNIEQDAKLKKWLFETRNMFGTCNYLILRDAIGDAIVYGEAGLRFYKGNLYLYKKNYYGIVYKVEDGIPEIMAYYISRKGLKVEENIDFDQIKDLYELRDYLNEKEYILLSTNEFINIRNNTSMIRGESPLTKDRQRIKLLLAVYSRLNYDIRYDGPGRIILHTDVARTTEEVSTTAAIKNGSSARIEERYKHAKDEATAIGEGIKNSSSDNVILLSGRFKDKITHLPRVTKATEFFDWISEEGVIVAQILGMSSVLVEVGKWSGNVSMEKIIDDAMINTIIPLRELYAVQFSLFIGRNIGVEKVYFDKYSMKQADDEISARTKTATTLRDLSYALKSISDVDTPVKKNLESIIQSTSEMLLDSMYDANNDLRPLLS